MKTITVNLSSGFPRNMLRAYQETTKRFEISNIQREREKDKFISPLKNKDADHTYDRYKTRGIKIKTYHHKLNNIRKQTLDDSR